MNKWHKENNLNRKKTKSAAFSFLRALIVLVFLTSQLPAHPVEKQFISVKLTFGKNTQTLKKWNGTVDIISHHHGQAVRMVELSERVFPDYNNQVWFEHNKVFFNGESKKTEVAGWIKSLNSKQKGHDPELHDNYGISPFSFIIHLFTEPGSRLFINMDTTPSFEIDLSLLSPGNQVSLVDGLCSASLIYSSFKLTDSHISSKQSCYNDYSDVVGTLDGAVYLSYISFTEGIEERINWSNGKRTYKVIPDFEDLNRPVGGDQLKLISILANGQKTEEELTLSGRDIYESKILIDADNKLWVFWSENSDGNWDLFYRYKNHDKWSQTFQLTNIENPDIHPEVAINDQGIIAVVYQSFNSKGSSIKYALIHSSLNQPPKHGEIYNSPANEWEPDIAVDKNGNFVVVWDTYQHGSYDVMLTCLRTDGVVSEPQYIAATEGFEANASLDVDQDNRVWIAYEYAGKNWGKDYGDEKIIEVSESEGLNMGRTIKVVCFSNDSLFETSADLGETIPRLKYEMNWYTKFQQPKRYERNTGPAHFLYWPQLKISADGTIGLVYKVQEALKGINKNRTLLWDNYVTFYDGKSWTSPVLLSGSQGQLNQKVSFHSIDNRFMFSYSGDSRNNFPRDSISKKMNVYLAIIQPEYQVFKPELKFSATGIDPVYVNKHEQQNLQALNLYQTESAGQNFKIYSGDTHRHTSFSPDGGLDGSFFDLMRYAMDAASLDWVNSADHDFGGSTAYEWYLTQKFTDVFHVKGYFYPIFGYERSVNFPDGHRNVLFANRGIRLLDRLSYDYTQTSESPDTEMLYQYLRQYNGISIPHTPISAGTDWRSNDPEVEPVVEIYQGCRESSEYIGAPRNGNHGREIGSYWAALKKGYRLGVIASSDHHSSHVSYAMVYMQDISRENIVKAIKKRHTYGATDNIVLDFRIGQYIMGDELTLGDESFKFTIVAIGTNKIAKIDIIKNCQEIIPHTFNNRKVTFEWEDHEPNSGLNYYYIRLIQEDGEMAWSSPIWINKE